MSRYPRTCRNGHLVEFLEAERGDGRCSRCAQATNRRYYLSEKGKKNKRKYNASVGKLRSEIKYKIKQRVDFHKNIIEETSYET